MRSLVHNFNELLFSLFVRVMSLKNWKLYEYIYTNWKCNGKNQKFFLFFHASFKICNFSSNTILYYVNYLKCSIRSFKNNWTLKCLPFNWYRLLFSVVQRVRQWHPQITFSIRSSSNINRFCKCKLQTGVTFTLCSGTIAEPSAQLSYLECEWSTQFTRSRHFIASIYELKTGLTQYSRGMFLIPR